MLIKRDSLINIGLFNENFFCYWEETELEERCKNVGFKIMYCPSSKIWHKISATAGQYSPFYMYFFTRNKVWFIRNKNLLLKYLIYFIACEFWITLLFLLIYTKTPKSIGAYLAGFMDGLLSQDFIYK